MNYPFMKKGDLLLTFEVYKNYLEIELLIY